MRSELSLLLRREWEQYRSVNGKAMLLIWVVYLLTFLVAHNQMIFMVVYLPVLMGYSAITGAKQQGETVHQGNEDILLPVPLEDIIRARYLFVFGITLVSSLVVAVVVQLARVLLGSVAGPVMVLGFSMSIMGIMALVAMPLVYRRGAARSRIYLILVVTMGAMAGGAAALVAEIGLTRTGIATAADFAYLVGAALIWCLSPLSARLTMKMYRRGGVDHEKRPIVQK